MRRYARRFQRIVRFKSAKIDSTVWRLRLLGDLSLERDGVEVRRLRAQKYAHLLAYLAIYSSRAHAREELIEIFWPDEPVEKARTCLRTALSSLRRQLDSPTLFLDGARDTIRLNPQLITTDVHAFENAVMSGDPNSRALYTGPFLSGCYYDWALDERIRLEALVELAPMVSPSTPKLTSGEIETTSVAKPLHLRLPAPITHFFGRVEEIDQICQLINESGSRLITLLGMGGIGKTRLAIEAARNVKKDVVAFVPLSEQTHLNGVVIQIADSIGLSRTPAETLESRLQTELANHNMLLVFDNFEQLVSDESCGWVQRILSQSPSLQLIVTSRLPLGIEGEHEFRLRPLSQPAALALFVDRARHVLPDFPESPVLAELCDSLDRVPLAVELCASWANVLSAPRMLSGLSQRFELMQSRKRMISDRHQNLRAVLEWSCPADSELRTNLGVLSILRGTWTLEAAEAVLGTPAAAIVSQLSERSLIQSEVVEGAVRFHLLESVRDFATEIVEPDTLRLARCRHNEFFCRLACFEAARHLDFPLAAFRSLALEHANIRAAFNFGLTCELPILDRTMRAMFRVKWCWWVRGYVADTDALNEKATLRVKDGYSGVVQGLLLSSCAAVAATQGRLADALDFSLKATEEFRKTDDTHMRTENLRMNSHYREVMGDFEGAIRELEAIYEFLPKDTSGYYINMAHLAGTLLDGLGDPDRAEPLYLEMLRFWDTQPYASGHIAVIKRSLGRCAMLRGNFDLAESLTRDAIQTFYELGEKVREAQSWSALSECLEKHGKTNEAAAAAERAQQIFREVS